MAVQPIDTAPLAQSPSSPPEEAADLLGVSVRTIRYWVAERRIPYFHLGRFIRFKPAELVAFLDSGRVDPLDR
jgi:excisionase family DNA binding protein